MPDGSVKVRGLATEAVLTGADRISDEQASRAQGVVGSAQGLVGSVSDQLAALR